MIAKRHIVIPAAIHHVRKDLGVLHGVVAESPQRGALEDIPSVDNQRITILMETVGAFEQANLPLLGAVIVCRVDMGMNV